VAERAVLDTALKMQMFHTTALLLVGVLLELPRGHERPRILYAAGWLFTAGLVLFSVSLISYALLTGLAGGDFSYLRKPAPFGGTAWILGWASLFVWSVLPRPHSTHPPL
ncbi:MAG: DUF423 domain-containing protein, partial [Spirochaetia bacterium]|nr:DUF423 domain-containing protein [Spirochaetia bacterium]